MHGSEGSKLKLYLRKIGPSVEDSIRCDLPSEGTQKRAHTTLHLNIVWSGLLSHPLIAMKVVVIWISDASKRTALFYSFPSLDLTERRHLG